MGRVAICLAITSNCFLKRLMVTSGVGAGGVGFLDGDMAQTYDVSLSAGYYVLGLLKLMMQNKKLFDFYSPEMITRTFVALASLAVVLLAPGVTQAKQDLLFCPVVKVQGREVDYTCEVEKYNLCHRMPSGFEGVRAGNFWNSDVYQTGFSITFYTGNSCNDKWARWSFENGFTGTYTIHDFQRKELWNNVRSFKMANYQTSTTTGNDQPKEGTVVMANCKTEKQSAICRDI
ncbi:hypothetical protein BGZ95_004238 [Linnemannia exigua]|uniref:Uncharacterized protein n=1 Tax=Linnemannia exigua TaxID=604196 RepID=A0AAD4D3Q1_9FUNG|nr:hypothetical protein BGZ95_004238 [Linnemannia exigua]